MSEMEEIKEMMRESGAKPPKRKIVKRGKIVIVGTVIVIAILIGIYVANIISIQQEKYWKPDKEFTMPSVDWSEINSSYTVKRTTYPDINGTIINQTIGSERTDGNFRVELASSIDSYVYLPHSYDDVHTVFYSSFTKLSGDYVVKELAFRYDFSDDYVKTTTIHYYSLASHNLYFTGAEGKYGMYSDKIEYEWMSLHEMRGINKDAGNIKNGGFCDEFEILLYDEYPNWINHTIIMWATLYYGHPTLLGWQDVHELSASVEIYVVPEGGE